MKYIKKQQINFLPPLTKTSFIIQHQAIQIKKMDINSNVISFLFI